MPGAEQLQSLARECGFELAGVAPAAPLDDFPRYQAWAEAGMAGAMAYLTDHRAALRQDPRLLLPTARSSIVVGKLYQTPHPGSLSLDDATLAWISRYAWGEDYHLILRQGLEHLCDRLREELGHDFDSRIAVDTAPLLERSLAHRAGLGWIGKNTCLIHERTGSWYFLGELLTSLDLAPGSPAPDRCGACTRCIDACPTAALTPYQLDARRCISYLTIELRGPIPEEFRAPMGLHVFGCDICQEVCPWNHRAPVTADSRFAPRVFAPPLARLAALTEEEFRSLFRSSPVWRAKYHGLLRNVAVAMGNAARPEFRDALDRLAAHADPVVAEHARWALTRLTL